MMKNGAYSRFRFMQIRGPMTSQDGQKDHKYHKIWNICANTTGLKFCRVDKLHSELHIVIAVIISP